jgi:hypothetical protein
MKQNSCSWAQRRAWIRSILMVCVVALGSSIATRDLRADDKHKKVFEPIADLPTGGSAVYVYLPSPTGKFSRFKKTGKFSIKVNSKSIGNLEADEYLATTGTGQVIITANPLFKFGSVGILDQALSHGPLNLNQKLKIDCVPGQVYYVRSEYQDNGAQPVLVFKLMDADSGFNEIHTLTEGKHK